MKESRHNGRAGKNGVYNPKHNDRNFDISNSDHIDDDRARNNIYWDCYQGYRKADEYVEGLRPQNAYIIQWEHYTEEFCVILLMQRWAMHLLQRLRKGNCLRQ